MEIQITRLGKKIVKVELGPHLFVIGVAAVVMLRIVVGQRLVRAAYVEVRLIQRTTAQHMILLEVCLAQSVRVVVEDILAEIANSRH